MSAPKRAWGSLHAASLIVELCRQERRDLSIRQLAVLIFAGGRLWGQSVGEFASELNISKAAVTRAMTRLVKEGLLVREKVRDGRKIAAKATAAGNTILLAIYDTGASKGDI